MSRIIKFFLVIIIVFLTYVLLWNHGQERARTRSITEERNFYKGIISVIQECEGMDDSKISIYGKIMFLNYEKTDRPFFVDDRGNMLEAKDDYLLKERIVSRCEGDDVTIFVISAKKEKFVGKYTSGDEAYEALFDIYVVKYPQKVPLGKHSILSQPPSHVYRQSPGPQIVEIGDVNDIVEWITGLLQKQNQKKQTAK